jgi:hypothetical protein
MLLRIRLLVSIVCFLLILISGAQAVVVCEPCGTGQIRVDPAPVCTCKCDNASGYYNQGGVCVVVQWKRVPAVAAGMSCEQLGGINLGSTQQVFWKLVESRNLQFRNPDANNRDVRGTARLACSCRWHGSYQLTSTKCRRPVEEEATINGVRRTRTTTSQDVIYQRESILVQDQTTSGWMTGVMANGNAVCTCDPPDGGQLDRE